MIPAEEIPPAFSIPLVDAICLPEVFTRISIHTCERILDWYNQSYPLTALDIYHYGPEPSDLTYTSLNLTLPQPPFEGRLECLSSSLLPITFNAELINLESRICNGRIIQGSLEKGLYRLTMIPDATETTSETEPLWFQISLTAVDAGSLTPRRDIIKHTFDPVSGRLCVMLARNWGITSILVFDLLHK